MSMIMIIIMITIVEMKHIHEQTWQTLETMKKFSSIFNMHNIHIKWINFLYIFKVEEQYIYAHMCIYINTIIDVCWCGMFTNTI